MRDSSKDQKGVTVIAALIAVLLLASLGAGVAYFIASNQATRVQQVTGDQAFYSSQAGIEFALGKIIKEGSQTPNFTRNFSGESVLITRTAGIVRVNSSKKDARDVHSITDPNPPNFSNCLVVNTASAAITGNTNLTGITLSRHADCTSPLVINSMTGTTWQPNNSEFLNTINIAGAPNEFSGSAGSSGTFDFGSNDYIINDGLSHNLTTMTWNANVTYHDFQLIFNFTYEGQIYSKSVPVQFLASNQANCFTWNTTNARLTYVSSLWEQLTGTTVSNSCAQPIRLDKMTVSWTPDSRNLAIVQINAVNIYSGSAASGSQIDVDDVIAASGTQTVNYLQFDNEVMGRNYTVVWTFSDGTSKTTTLDLFNAAQNNCLTINTASVAASSTDITGLTVQNTCGADIGMTAITMSWEGEPTRRLTESVIEDVDSSNTYTSNNASGVAVNLGDNDLYLPDGGGVKNITRLTFNDAITSIPYTLTFTMADGTTKSVTFTPTASTQATCLNVSIGGAGLSGGQNKDLSGIAINNTCGYTITWSHSTVSWTPTIPLKNLTQIRVDNSNVYNGPDVGSGVQVDNTDVTLTNGQTKDITRIRFDSGMSDRTFTIQFKMVDASIKTVTPIGPF